MNSNTYGPVGRMLDQYMPEQLIKRSKMSTVYRAWQLNLARTVAVKVMNNRLDNEFLLCFHREAHMMAQLDHANIVPIYDYGEQDGLAFLVMPYYPRGSLYEVLVDRGRLSQQEILTYIQQAAAALDYAHAFGIVHLDLKPSNFLLHADGRLVLTDFGIARIIYDSAHATDSLSRINRPILGTPEYMPPEMIRGEQIDYLADIYELGIILYQMLSGNIPFIGDDIYAILSQQLQEPLPLVHQIDKTIPPEVDAVIRRATAKKREERYTSAKALARALQTAFTTPTYCTIIDLDRTFDRISLNVPPRVHKAAINLEERFTFSPHSTTKAATHKPKVVHPGVPNTNLFRTFFFTLLAITLIACGLVISFMPLRTHEGPSPAITTSTLVPKSAPTPSQTATEAVQHYYDTWNNGDYPDTYSQLDSDYQEAHPYNTLISSYENTLHSSIMINSITQLSNGVFKVAVTDFAIEKSSSGTQTVNRVYQGYYIVKKENGKWKLTPYFKY